MFLGPGHTFLSSAPKEFSSWYTLFHISSIQYHSPSISSVHVSPCGSHFVTVDERGCLCIVRNFEKALHDGVSLLEDITILDMRRSIVNLAFEENKRIVVYVRVSAIFAFVFLIARTNVHLVWASNGVFSLFLSRRRIMFLSTHWPWNPKNILESYMQLRSARMTSFDLVLACNWLVSSYGILGHRCVLILVWSGSLYDNYHPIWLPALNHRYWNSEQ